MYKILFFEDKNPIELSPVFEAFRLWLVRLFSGFSEGFSPERSSRRSTSMNQESNRRQLRVGGFRSSAVPRALVPSDNETLGRCVDYSTIIEPTRSLKGELEGFIIRHGLKTNTPQAGAY